MRFPLSDRIDCMLIAVGCSLLCLATKDFMFIAIQILVINLAAAVYSRGLLRIGFAGVVASNVFWIAARKGTEAWIGHELPIAYRYDNDLFHFMLIASTFTVYKAFSRGKR